MAVRRFAENIIVKSEFETNETESQAQLYTYEYLHSYKTRQQC